DIALALIDPKFYTNLGLQYQGSTPEGKAVSFFVTKVDDHLTKGKTVFLFGRYSTKEGKLATIEPVNMDDAPYDRAKAPKSGDKIPMACLLTIDMAYPKGGYSLSVQGDSGGLWVSDDGAVGIQLMGGVGTKVATIHP